MKNQIEVISTSDKFFAICLEDGTVSSTDFAKSIDTQEEGQRAEIYCSREDAEDRLRYFQYVDSVNEYHIEEVEIFEKEKK